MASEIAVVTGASKAGWWTFKWLKQVGDAGQKIEALETRVAALEALLVRDRDARPHCRACGTGRIDVTDSLTPMMASAQDLPEGSRFEGHCSECYAWWVLDAAFTPTFRKG